MRLPIFKIPQEPLIIGVSGGVDSMCLLHLVVKTLGFGERSTPVSAFNFNHLTPYGYSSIPVVEEFSSELGVPLIKREAQRMGRNEGDWKQMRDAAIKEVMEEEKASLYLTAHHLNDALEWYLLSCLQRYKGEVMRAVSQREGFVVRRPFLPAYKHSLREYATLHKVPHIEDPSNTNLRWKRNYVRQKMVEDALNINPGLPKFFRKTWKRREGVQPIQQRVN